MSSGGFRSMRRILVEAVESAFWTSLLAGAVTAVFAFPAIFVLMWREYAGEMMVFAFPPACALSAAISGVVWGVVSAVWRPPRLRQWLIAGAVGIGLGLLLSVAASISRWETAYWLAILCWFAFSAVVVPAASAACVDTWLLRRGRRGVRYSRVAAVLLVVVVLAAVVGTELRILWLTPGR